MRNYTGNGYEGKNYNQVKDLPRKEVVKLIKAEIKREYPHIKVSVRNESFSMGSCIHANILIDESKIKEFNTFEEWDRYRYLESKKINTIMNRFNYDDSNSQIDYFDTDFYTESKIFVDLDDYKQGWEDSERIKEKYFNN